MYNTSHAGGRNRRYERYLNMNDKKDLTQGAIWQKMLLFFLPVAAGTLFQQFYNTIDAMIVGRNCGPIALAAVGGSSSQIVNLIVNSFVGLTNGAAIVVAQLFGAGHRDKLSAASNSSMTFCAVSGLIIGALGMIFTPQMLYAMGTPVDTIPDAIIYLRYYFAGTIFILMFNMGSGILRACGDSRSPFIYLCLTSVLHIALDLVFVAGMKLAVTGIGLATIISNAFSAVIVSHKLRVSKESYATNVLKPYIDRPLLSRMIGLGVPTGLESAMFGISNILMMTGINSLGSTAVAAWTLSSKVDGFYWATMTAMGATIMTFVGQNYGAGKVERIKTGMKQGMIIFQIVTVFFTAALLLFSKPLFELFMDAPNPDVVETGWMIIKIMVPFYVFWTVGQLYAGSLKGISDAKAAVVLTAVSICVFRVGWRFTAFLVRRTLGCICWSYPISWILMAACMVFRFRTNRWQDQILSD